MSLPIQVSANIWRKEFYRALICVATAFNHRAESQLMQDLLLDKARLDQLIDEALISHLEPRTAAREFVAFLFVPSEDRHR